MPPEVGGWFDILRFHLREVVMPFTRLVLQIAHECLLIAEPCSQLFGISQIASSVVSDINDESITEGKILEDLVQSAVANGVGEAGVIHIADIVVKDAVVHARGDAIVCSEVFPLQCIAEVRGIILMPTPVSSVIERRVEVHVAVAQLCQHVGEHFEQLIPISILPRAYLIFIVDGIPIQPILLLLIVEEAVMLVDNLPECLEIALRCIGKFLLVNTGDNQRSEGQQYE